MLHPSTESTHPSVASCSVYMAQNVLRIGHKIWEMYKETNSACSLETTGQCRVVVMVACIETIGSSVWFCSLMYRNGYWHIARLGPQHCRVPWELPRAWCELGCHRVHVRDVPMQFCVFSMCAGSLHMLTELKQPRHMFEVYLTLAIETCVCIVLCVNPLYA